MRRALVRIVNSLSASLPPASRPLPGDSSMSEAHCAQDHPRAAAAGALDCSLPGWRAKDLTPSSARTRLSRFLPSVDLLS